MMKSVFFLVATKLQYMTDVENAERVHAPGWIVVALRTKGSIPARNFDIPRERPVELFNHCKIEPESSCND